MNGRFSRTLLKFVIHLANLVSNLVGDDVVSKAIRHGVLRLLGSRLGRSTSLHGGTYFSWPSHLSVGDHVFINRSCYFDLEAPIVIEDHATVGHGVTFITTAHEIGGSSHRAGRAVGRTIVVGGGSWLGAECIVLPGITIGRGSVVAAGAVVTRDVEPDTLVAGVPARLLRTLVQAETDGDG